MSLGATRPARSLADALRRASADDLSSLLVARPDLCSPIPADLATLAARAASAPSVQRCLDGLDAVALAVLEVMAALPEPLSVDHIAPACSPMDPAVVRDVIARVRELGLAWGDEQQLRLVAQARTAFGKYPCGLAEEYAAARRVVAELIATPDHVRTQLAEAPASAQELMAAMLWGPPAGTVHGAQRPVTVESARTPVEWLLARGYLVATDTDTVVIPRDVALILRDGRMLRDAPSSAPAVTGITVEQADVDRLAGRHALAFVRAMTALVHLWHGSPAALVRSGGLAVRETTRTALALDIPEATLGVLIEIGIDQGLLAPDADAGEVMLPTEFADHWLEQPEAHRWATLAVTWLDMERTPSLVGTEDAQARRIAAGSMALIRGDVPALRRAALQVLADHEGCALSSDSVVEVLHWQRPRRATAMRDTLIRAFLAEADLMGITARNALAGHGHSLLRAVEAAAFATQIDAAMPERIEYVLIQADLTAIAPGPLVAAMDTQMRLMADVESADVATVFRFSDASMQRALASGLTASEIRERLTTWSRTPLPQALEYLINDAERRFGSLRITTATTVVTSDDEALIASLPTHQQQRGVTWTVVAPTVAVTSSPPDVVTERLREAGLAPVAMSGGAATVLPATRIHRPASGHRTPVTRTTVSSDRVRAIVAALTRTGDEATQPIGELPRSSAVETKSMIATAISEQTAIQIGYTDGHGSAATHIVDPLALEGGFLTAYDHASRQVRTFTLARITGAAPHAMSQGR